MLITRLQQVLYGLYLEFACYFFAIKCGPMFCRRFHEKYEEDEYSAYDLAEVLCGVATVILVIVGIIVITVQMFDIATCMTFPEKIVINEIQSIYQSVK